MSLEERDNLLGAWAIHCDTPDCHIEVLNISEADVEELAKSEGWKLDGTTHLCGDCAAGNSPMDVIKEDLPQAAAGRATPEGVDEGVDEGYAEDVSDEDARLNAQEEERLGLAEKPMDDELAAAKQRRKAERDKPKEKFEPFDERSGATIPDVIAKAEDMETPTDKDARLRREKRSRQRREEAKKQSKEKTLAAMGGVNDLLDDFDGLFGSSKTTWDD